MKKIELSDIRDCEAIYQHKGTIMLSGGNPVIARKDGTIISRLDLIRNSYKIVFLPDNMAIIDGGADFAYHYVSLVNGQIIWSIYKPDTRTGCKMLYATTKNGDVVYCLYERNKKLYADAIHIQEKSICTHLISTDLRATLYCYCDDNDHLSILQSFTVKEEQPYVFYGILRWSPCLSPEWKYHWRSGFDFESRPCVCNDSFVLFNDLSVYSISEGTRFNLLENSFPIKVASRFIQVDGYDEQRKLLTVRFMNSWSTIIIDCVQRKIVAHYRPFSPELSGGCLIDNEFWLGSKNGVIQRPFPHMDLFPKIL